MRIPFQMFVRWAQLPLLILLVASGTRAVGQDGLCLSSGGQSFSPRQGPEIFRAIYTPKQPNPEPGQEASQTGSLRIFGRHLTPDPRVTVSPECPNISRPFISTSGRIEVGLVDCPRPAAVWVDVGGEQSEAIRVTEESFIGNEGTIGGGGEIRRFHSIIDPKNAADMFGRRVARRFIAIQVLIVNTSSRFDYILRDVSLDLIDLGIDPRELTARELSLVRGVAEKGRSFDRRNLVLRLLRGLGSVGAGFVGLDIFGNSYPEGTALFNGPVLAAFADIFPDHTIGQTIRLSDSAYVANTVIPKTQSKVIVAFLPQAMLLTNKQRKVFWKEPIRLFTECPELDLRRIKIRQEGSHLQEIEALPPLVTAAFVKAGHEGAFQSATPSVPIQIIGRFLAGSTVEVSTEEPEGLTVSSLKNDNPERLEFNLQSKVPVRPNEAIRFNIVKDKESRETTLRVAYEPEPAVISEATLTGDSLVVKGSNFVPGITEVRLTPANLSVTESVVKANEITGKVTVPAGFSGDIQAFAVLGGKTESNRVTVEQQ